MWQPRAGGSRNDQSAAANDHVIKDATFSAAVGVIFGYFPARRAVHLDPIQALRYE